MSSWEQQKASLASKKQELDTKTSSSAIESIVSGMNAAIFRYTQSAGISRNPDKNVDYTEANSKFQQISDYQQQYADLNKTLSNTVRQMTDSADVKNKLAEVGKLRNEIAQMEKELETTKTESETSVTRQQSVEKPRQELSWYQGFSGLIGFTKPLKQFSIAFLVGFGLLFLFFSGLMLRDFFLPTASGSYATNLYAQEGLFSVFTDARFFAVMAGVGLVLTVLLILSMSGKLGKNAR